MKLLYVVHSFPPHHYRGTEVYSYELSKEMGARGHEVKVLYLLSRRGVMEPFLEEGEYDGIKVVRIVKEILPENPKDYFFDTSLDRLFEDFIRAYRPNLVHFTYFAGGFSISMLEVAKRLSRTFFTITDYASFCPRGQLIDYKNQPCYGPRMGIRCLKCLFGKNLFFENNTLDRIARDYFPIFLSSLRMCSELKLLKRRFDIIKFSLSRADTVIFAHLNTLSVFKRQGFKFKRTALLDFGIDKTRFREHRKGVSEKLRIGYFGQILAHKGLHILLDAIKLIDRKEELKLFIYGSLDDPGAREYFESIAIKDEQLVEFCGVVDYPRLNSELEKVDLIVVPSLWDENCPLIVKYALFTGTRLLVSDVPGIVPELVSGIEGIDFFPKGDSKVLSLKILEILKDKRYKKPLGLREDTVLDISDHCAVLEKLYEEVL